MLAWLAFIWMCDLFNTLSTGGVGGEERGGGGLGGIVFFHYGERDLFFLVRENAKRAAAYNGGVMGEAVRGVSVKDTLGSASRRTSRWSSFVFLAATCRLESPRENAQKHHVENERRETKAA